MGSLIQGNPMEVENSTTKMEKPLIKHGLWSQEEDRNLLELVKRHGGTKWDLIALNIGVRDAKQCHERWSNHLRPAGIEKDSWSEEEERIFIEAHAKVGNRWTEIAEQIPGRTECEIKNHWNHTKRKLNSRNNIETVNQRGNDGSSYVLLDYIRSNNLNSTTTITNSLILSSQNQFPSIKLPELSHAINIYNSTPLMNDQTYDLGLDEEICTQLEDIFSKNNHPSIEHDDFHPLNDIGGNYEDGEEMHVLLQGFDGNNTQPSTDTTQMEP